MTAPGVVRMVPAHIEPDYIFVTHSRIPYLVGRMIAAPRWLKQALQLANDACALVFVAFGLPWLTGTPIERLLADKNHLAFIAIYVSLGLCILWMLGFYRIMIRKLDQSLAARAVTAFLGLSLLTSVVFLERTLSIRALALGIACGGLSMGAIILSRLLARGLLNLADSGAANVRTVFIYGAGQAGCALAKSLKDDPHYRAAAFVDDDPSLKNIKIGGLIVRPPHDLKALSLRFKTRKVVLAMPSLGRARRREIMERLVDLGFKVLSVPALSDLISGRTEVSALHKIDICELLGRSIVDLEENQFHNWFKDRTVLITGAGGTIGSEIARQASLLGIRRLILFDASEAALYAIHRELADRDGTATPIPVLVPVLGSVADPAQLRAIFSDRRIDAVFHAAAYKHVPLIEENALSGIRNNVLGTELLAEAAGRARVNRFILISTDKAVRPVGVMGATKRLAELSIGAAQARYADTIYSLVRFGNVLNSSGSVVPRFKRQILNGGPVTVTHPEITRYFMTIPEAAQLVIAAGLQANGGEVFVLDMGEPVKILDLARRLIRLSGADVKDAANPDGEIEIRFTGLRPGEKLFEELLIGESTLKTPHPKIFAARESRMTPDEMASLVSGLTRAVEDRDLAGAMHLIEDALPGYTRSQDLADADEARRLPRDGGVSGSLQILPGGRS